MQKLVLAPDMWLYTFPEKPMYISILALIYEDKAFLVDSGFTDQASAIKADLLSHGIEVQFVFCNHFNVDHIVGNHIFHGAEILGSECYSFHLERAKQMYPDHKWVEPTVLLKGGERMTFGAFMLEFIHLPGHTDCSILLRIDCSTLHVADNIIRLLDGTDMVPFHMHPDSKGPEFVATLEAMKRLAPERIILSHATVIEGPDKVQEAIDSRIYYMKKIMSLGPTAKLKDCLDNGIPITPTSEQWHEKNLKLMYNLT